MHYQSDRVPRSLTSTGRVGTRRDLAGSDAEFFGVDPVPTSVAIEDGRGAGFSLDDNGFCMVGHAWDHIDYYDNSAILNVYYAEVESLVQRETGASRVIAFDHNLRAKQRKQAGGTLKGGGASAVQEPLITYGVHNDFTLESAPRRINQLARPLGANDTLRARTNAPPPLEPEQLPRLLGGRWQFVNVWRNVRDQPVERFPLAMIDAATVSLDDLVVFEICYADRVGENYFARHSPRHRWSYYPRLTRDEAVLLKCWDSHGCDFAPLHASSLRGRGRGRAGGSSNVPAPGSNSHSSNSHSAVRSGAPLLRGSAVGVPARTVRATFSLHSGFEDPATPLGAPDRESIEVRTVAFFEE